MKNCKARFISFEGGEGAGKSTQLAWLHQAFEKADIAHIVTREPGGTTHGEALRELLVHTPATGAWQPETEALLMMAARLEHVRQVIIPALEAGKWVLCDRFVDSTIVYQGMAQGLGQEWIRMLHRQLMGNLLPDLTFYLDIAPEVGLARTRNRDEQPQRFEQMDLSFHHRVHEGFLTLHRINNSRIIIISGSNEPHAIHNEVVNKLNVHTNINLVPTPALNKVKSHG